MREYRNLVLDMLEPFEEYKFFIIPRSKNTIADAYVIAANTFKILIDPNKTYTIEVKHRPAIPNNVKYLQVFQDDDHIEDFLTLSGDYENMIIEEEEEEEKAETAKIEELPDDELQNNTKLLNHLGDKEIIQLKSNYFPKGLVPLEELFDQNGVAKAPGVIPVGTEVEDFNIGT